MALMMAITSPLVAADGGGDALTESDFLAEIPKVLTASRLSQPINQAPAAVSIVDREMIHASGATNIAELLRLVSGFMVAERRGEQYTTPYRAIADQFTRNMQVLVDGVSVYQVEFGEMQWWSLPVPVEDVERIEVVRSPNAAGYGSNAFQGVINIVTRDPAAAKGGQVLIQSGSYGFHRGAVRYSGSSDKVDFRATVGVNRSTGFADLPDTMSTPFVLLRGDVHLSASDELQLQLGQSEPTFESGYYNDARTPPHGTTARDQIFQARWGRTLGQDADFSLQYASTRNQIVENYSIALPAPILTYPISLGYEGGRDSLELTHRWRPYTDVRLAWGMETRHDFVRSYTWFYGEKSYDGNLARLFVNGEWRATPDWTLHAGAMLEKHYFTGTDLYPRLAANYQISARHSLRASVSKGFRPPTFFEQKGDKRFVWNGVLLDQVYSPAANALKSEQVVSREIGYLGEFREIGLTLDARVSVDHYRDMIKSPTQGLPPGTELMGSDETSIFSNAYNAKVVGAELQARWQPSRGDLVVANYAHTHIQSSGLSAELSADSSAASSIAQSGPRHIGSLLVSHHFTSALAASAIYYRVSSMKWSGGGGYVPRYERLDMKLAYKLRPGRTGDELALVVKNVLNTHDVSFNADNVERTRAFVSLTLDF